MALAIAIKNLEDVDESLRQHYVKDGDQYRLEGVPDTIILETTLKKERDARKDFEAKLKALDGIEPDEYQRLKQEEDERKKKKMIDGGKVDELLAEQREQLEKKHKTDIDALTTERDALLTTNRKLLLTDVMKAEALKESAHESALDDIVARATAWQLQDGKPVALDNESAPILRDGRHLTMNEWLKDLQSSASHLFKDSGGGGTPPGGGAPPGGDKVITRTQFDAMNHVARQKFFADGGVVKD